MLPSSVRRAASIAPHSPVLSSFSATLPRTTVGRTLACRPNRHQRRYSSSKPSSPADGSKDVPDGRSVPASTSSTSQGAKSGERRKRKAKDAQAIGHQLPSVPSTQHLPLESLALSSFFSQHRPISITHSLPKSVTDDSFATIFLPRIRGQKTSDVISTLSKAVSDLESPMTSLSLSNEQADEAMDDNIHKIELKHSDGSGSSVYVQLNAMAGQFLPFQPPPLPAPQAEVEAVEAGAEQALDDEPPHTKIYKAVLTIEEQTDADGQVRIVAHSPQIIEEPTKPRTFLERMAVRHLKYEEGRRYRERMHALSVLRRRKLKMKKKKYKKLMKKTRNLRRKLDRN